MNSSSLSTHARAVLMLLLANLLWGISFPTIKALTMIIGGLVPEAGSWFVTVMTVAPRFMLATLILLAVFGRKLADTTGRELRQGLFLGAFASVGMLFQNDGLQFTEASTSAFLTQLYAILIPVWFALRRRKNPGGWVWLCCVFVLSGVAILGHFDWRTLSLGRGEVETLVSSLFFMGQILTLENPAYAGNRPERITFVMVAVEALLFGCVALITAPNLESLVVPWSSPVWVGLTLVLTLFCTLGAFSIMNAWQPKISSTEAGLIYCVEPIFGTLLSLFLPGLYSLLSGVAYANEEATWSLLVGGSLITIANVLLQLVNRFGGKKAVAEACG